MGDSPGAGAALGGQGGQVGAEIRKFLERHGKCEFEEMKANASGSREPRSGDLPQRLGPSPRTSHTVQGTVCLPVCLPQETTGGSPRAGTFPNCCPPLSSAWRLLGAQNRQDDPLTTGSILDRPLVWAPQAITFFLSSFPSGSAEPLRCPRPPESRSCSRGVTHICHQSLTKTLQGR